MQPLINSWDDILMRLQQADRYCVRNDIYPHFWLYGSALGHYYIENYAPEVNYRQSGDIDYRICLFNDGNPLQEDEHQHAFARLEINCLGGCQEMPSLEDIPVQEVLEGLDNLVVFIPTIEVFAFSKLNVDSRKKQRDKDIEDLFDYPILDLCDRDALYELIEDAFQYSYMLDDPSINLYQLPEFIEIRQQKHNLQYTNDNSIIFDDPEEVRAWLEEQRTQ